MTIQYFTYPPEAFPAVQYDGTNLDEIAAFVGEDNIVGLVHGEPVISLGDGEQDSLRVGWWVSVVDGELGVSSHRAGRRWIPSPPAVPGQG